MEAFPYALLYSESVEDWVRAGPLSFDEWNLESVRHLLEWVDFRRFGLPRGRTGEVRLEFRSPCIKIPALPPPSISSSGEPLKCHDLVALDLRQTGHATYLLCPGFLAFEDGWFYFSPDGVKREMVSSTTFWKSRER